MNNYASNKYFFSPQQHRGNGGTFIVVPNQARTDNALLNTLRSFTSLLHRVCPN